MLVGLSVTASKWETSLYEVLLSTSHETYDINWYIKTTQFYFYSNKSKVNYLPVFFTAVIGKKKTSIIKGFRRLLPISGPARQNINFWRNIIRNQKWECETFQIWYVTFHSNSQNTFFLSDCNTSIEKTLLWKSSACGKFSV